MANIAKIEPGATRCQYPMKIMRQMWKLANIARTGLSADQQQYPMKIIRGLWKLANITKMSPRASLSISRGNHGKNLEN